MLYVAALEERNVREVGWEFGGEARCVGRAAWLRGCVEVIVEQPAAAGFSDVGGKVCACSGAYRDGLVEGAPGLLRVGEDGLGCESGRAVSQAPREFGGIRILLGEGKQDWQDLWWAGWFESNPLLFAVAGVLAGGVGLNRCCGGEDVLHHLQGVVIGGLYEG